MQDKLLTAVCIWTLGSSVLAGDIGFDPGLRYPAAASLQPRGQHYKEDCPASPTNRCYGTLPVGGGFYTLPLEVDENYLNYPQYFANYFNWVLDKDGAWVAQLEIDTRKHPTTATPAFYAGLQTNIPIGDMYAGLNFNNPNHAPPANHINHASLEFRAAVCPNNNDPYFLTLHYYSDGWAVKRNSGYSLAFNYAFSWNTQETPWVFQRPLVTQGMVMRELGFAEDQAKLYDTTFWIDAHLMGMLPLPQNNSAIAVTCNGIEHVEWKSARFFIQQFLELFSAKGILFPSSEYRYTGGIIAGVEIWGRAKVTIQVKNHRLRSDFPSSKDHLFRLADQTLWHRDQYGGICRYASIEHAGVYAIQDVPQDLTGPPASWSWCPGFDGVNLFYPLPFINY